MATAAAPNFEPAADSDKGLLPDPHGVQGLLQPGGLQPNYPAQIGAAALYALLLGMIVTLSFKTAEAPIEEQQVIELAPVPVEEPPPPEDTPPPPEELALPDELPPPPPVMEPIAPVEPPKPVVKPAPKPKLEKKVEKPTAKPTASARPTTARAAPGPRTDAPAVRAPAPAGATSSAIANQFHACMQRAAANAYPDSQAPRTAHISYHATFSATGSMTSFSISPSGNGAFDAVANRLGGRCGSVAAPGKPVSLSGSFTFSP
jgi:periplasmic protein TonB